VKAVSTQVGRSIATIAHETTFEIWSRLPRQARQHAKNPVLIPAGGLPVVIGSLATACHHAATLPSQSPEASKAYQAVEPALNYLSGVLAPRVAIAGVDLELLAGLADVEEADASGPTPWAWPPRESCPTNRSAPTREAWPRPWPRWPRRST
jgi:hypothetical protein